MPELGPDSPLIDKPETEQPTNYEQSVKTSREGLARLFDTASEAGESPLQQLLDDLQNNEGANYIYGGQKVDDLVIRLQSLTWSDKESFIDAVLEVIDPLLQHLGTDSEASKHFNEVEAGKHIEKIPLEHLDLQVCPCKWDIPLNESTTIARGQLVVDISWPDDRPGPKGLSALKTDFKKLCELLQTNQDIKGVIMTSWMMSHSITERLGFQVAPVTLTPKQIEGSLSRGLAGRKDKPYDWQIDQEDVKLGIMSREDFLKRFA
jgi:hypothetical protein